MNFSQEQIKQLELFITACKQSPEMLYLDELSFFRQYLQSLGAKIPPKVQTDMPKTEDPQKEDTANKEDVKKETSESTDKIDEDEIVESDLELDMTGVIEGDDDVPLPMGDDSKEITEEEMDNSDEKRRTAMQAISEDDYEKAIALFGEAIELNPKSASLFAKRANCLLKLNKPNACIQDCNQAITLNPDNAQAYKYRGRAYRLLGKWEEATTDLATACKLDYDDQANEWLKEVQPNAKKLHDHRRKYERLFEEKKIKEQQQRLRKLREEQEHAAKQDIPPTGGMPGGMPGGIPGGMPDLSFILNDPDIMQELQDPEVSAAFQDISTNPVNFMKYQSNPKVARVMAKMAQKMGGPGGKFPGGFPGFSP